MKANIKEIQRVNRHKRIRKKISGVPERPRLCVHRSLKNLQAQIVDDTTGKVLLGLSTLDKNFKGQNTYGGNVSAAGNFGEFFANQAQQKGVKKVSFDRGGYLFHGRIKAFAEGLRKGGLEF